MFHRGLLVLLLSDEHGQMAHGASLISFARNVIGHSRLRRRLSVLLEPDGIRLECAQGAAVFVPALDGSYEIGGTGTMFRAAIGGLG